MYSIMHGHPNCQVTIQYHTILALITVATDPQLPCKWPSPWPFTYIIAKNGVCIASDSHALWYPV